MKAKKKYGSKSRREKEALEFKEKISLRDETDEILSLIHDKKKRNRTRASTNSNIIYRFKYKTILIKRLH